MDLWCNRAVLTLFSSHPSHHFTTPPPGAVVIPTSHFQNHGKESYQPASLQADRHGDALGEGRSLGGGLGEGRSLGERLVQKNLLVFLFLRLYINQGLGVLLLLGAPSYVLLLLLLLGAPSYTVLLLLLWVLPPTLCCCSSSGCSSYTVLLLLL